MATAPADVDRAAVRDAVAGRPRSGSSPRARFTRQVFPYAMAAPAVLAVAILVGIPILFNVYLGFTDTSGFTGLDRYSWTGFENYGDFLSDPTYQSAFVLTLVWTGANLLLQVSVGMMFALILHSTSQRLARLIQPLWILPWVLPSVSMFFVWKMLYDPVFGGLNGIIDTFGLASTHGLLATPSSALWGVVIAGVWKGFPFYMLVFYAGLQAVPQDLYDAARVDGANRAQVFRFIELPELRLITLTVSILGFVWTFNWFTPIYILTQGGPGDATLTMPLYVYQTAIKRFELGLSAAAANGLLLVVTVAFVLLQRRQRSSLGSDRRLAR